MGLLDALQGTTTDPSTPATGGLLDSFMNWAKSSKSQPAADGLLAAGLGILANNHGLTSGTQAIGLGGLQGLQQYGQTQQSQLARQMQAAQLQQLGYTLQKNKMLLGMAQNLMGPGGAAPAAPQAGAPGPSPTLDAGGLPAGASGSGPGVASSPVPGMPMPPAAVQQGGAPQSQQAAPSGAPMFGNMPNNLAAFGLMTDPSKLFEQAASQYSPTDIQRQLVALGYKQGSPEYNAALGAVVKKAGYIAPVRVSAGGGLQEADGSIRTMPAAAPAGYQNVQGADGTWSSVPVKGGLDAEANASRARASGQAAYKVVPVWDQSANGGKGGMVNQTAANIADAAGIQAPGSAPGQAPIAAPVPGFSPFQNAIRQVESGGRPGAVNPASGASGSMQVMGPTLSNPGFGVPPARDNSPAEKQRVGAQYAAAMQQKYGNDTDAAVAYDWGHTNADKWISAGRPWKMLPPETQAYVGQVHSQMQNYANPPQGGGAAPSGPMAAEPAPGMVPNANTAQAAGAHTMQDSYSALQAGRSTAGAALDALQMMQGLGASKSPATIGALANVAALNPFDPTAAEYQKQRANVIGLLAKQGGLNGSDAARQLVEDSVPDYGKPKAAIQEGLQTLINQTKTQQIKANLLTPAYNAGDSKTYTALENGFDQHITPALVPLLEMPAGPQRAAALKSAAMNPQKRTALEWAVQNGVLK